MDNCCSVFCWLVLKTEGHSGDQASKCSQWLAKVCLSATLTTGSEDPKWAVDLTTGLCGCSSPPLHLDFPLLDDNCGIFPPRLKRVIFPLTIAIMVWLKAKYTELISYELKIESRVGHWECARRDIVCSRVCSFLSSTQRFWTLRASLCPKQVDWIRKMENTHCQPV